jgi:hypothetical protein
MILENPHAIHLGIVHKPKLFTVKFTLEIIRIHHYWFAAKDFHYCAWDGSYKIISRLISNL